MKSEYIYGYSSEIYLNLSARWVSEYNLHSLALLKEEK